MKYQSFAEFYPYYLQEHRDPVCRKLHYVGSSLVILCLFTFFLTGNLHFLWLSPLIGYGFAWVGHFFFEKNRPATFIYPMYSFCADWVMLKDAILSVFGFKTPLDHISKNSLSEKNL